MDLRINKKHIHDLVENETSEEKLSLVQELLETKKKNETKQDRIKKRMIEGALKSSEDINEGRLLSEKEFWKEIDEELEKE